MTSKYSRVLKYYTLVLAFCTFLLIIAGGLVTSTDSGLSVPDWPLSYGKLMPPMVGGILYEHGHRMVATTVGLLTVILLILFYRKEERSWLRKLGVIALAAVIVQGVLGGLTVLYLLPTWISVSHATLAQTFFWIVGAMALFESSWWQDGRLPSLEETAGRSVFSFGLVVIGTVYVQLILGALMRHTGSGLAVPDFPLAYGQIFPSFAPDALSQYNHLLIAKDIRMAADGPITKDQILIHMLHRLWAVVTGVVVLTFAYKLFRLTGRIKALRIPATILALLVPLQITLGAYTILTRKEVDVTTAHVATGALILMVSVISTLMLYRVIPHPVSERRGSFNLKEAATT